MNFGSAAVEFVDLNPMPEDTVLDESDKEFGKTSFCRLFVQVHEIISEFDKTVKPLEGVESFNKGMNEIEINATRAIKHTLTSLSKEVNHGKSILDESREKLEEFRHSTGVLEANSNRTFPSTFFLNYIDDLGKKASDITETIRLFEKSMEPSKSTEDPRILKELLESQSDAIVRCGTKMADIKDKSDKLMEKLIRTFKKHGLQTDHLEFKRDIEKDSDSLEIESSFKQYLAQRKRDLEKRDTKTNFSELCSQTAKTSFGAGTNKLGTSSGSTINKGTGLTGLSLSTSTTGGSAQQAIANTTNK